MSMDSSKLAALVDAQSAVLGLPIAPQHRAGVILGMERIAQMAELVTSFPLDVEDEAAPVFSHER